MQAMQQLRSSKILVTGGAGFIGSNLAEALLREGSRVVCLDNFSTGKQENIKDFLTHPDFSLLTGDIRNADDCRRACEGTDYVLHQAALGSVPRSIKDPATSNDVNVGGFVNMLVAARDAGVKRFVYAASSSTYGDHPALPKKEDVIGKPLSPYAITKYVNELYAGVFADLYGMQTIGLRYFNVFGKRQDPDGAYAAVIPKFIKQLVKGDSPVINGDGSQSRDFTYIDNVVQINLLALLTDNPAALNTVYNVAYGESTTLNELFGQLSLLLQELGLPAGEIRPLYGPPRAGDVQHSLASIEKARELLGYNPKYNLSEGLKQAITWYYENLK
ncbi:UDP-N-acetylglucosamine 4-epimerase [bioreactor metagenome]|jgi:UDP-N-acetylglucosamine 4-epimerase|uniref:UDP-N-acetylglucosamine 4-epimerase n=1 Tax=bioreactor metagenome TaxID=1076179 RepID=A0A644TRS3_9ZZZZ|nr:SDR family oxidoreductase [Lentimicrobium sp.]MEA5110508.1 SDR family oxidoreductase [Lentimicrobium sp.]